MKSIFAIIILVACISATGAASIGAGMVAEITVYGKKDPYSSGFDHGCSDAQIDDPNDWYINGVNSKGESTGRDHHTAAFNAGYDAGFKECGHDDGGYYIVNNDDHSNEQNQAAYTNQRGECGLILIGDCHIGQSSKNNFANAND